jgi:hypothetical protein
MCGGSIEILILNNAGRTLIWNKLKVREKI